MDEIKSTHVLYLSYDGLTDPLGQSQILPYLSDLAKKDYSITIISFEKTQRFHSGKENISKQCNDAGITWQPLLYHKNPPVISTVYDLFTLRQACVRLFQTNSYQIVHCRSYITALTGLWLKRKYGIRFIFDMRGFWADERVEGNLWPQSNPLFKIIYRFFKRKEKEMIREADNVVTLTESARVEISGWNIPTNISVIPCCVDLTLFNKQNVTDEQKQKIRTDLKIKSTDFVLLYLGSLGTWYLYDEMFCFFKLLKQHRPDAKFLFLTPDVSHVEPDPDVIVRTISRNEVPAYIASCDASICFIKPSFSKKGSSATKMAEVLAMDIPVVTNPGWGDVDYLEKHLHNLMISRKGEESEIIHQLLNLSPESEPSLFTRLFALEQGVEKYSGIYNRLKKQRNN